MCCVTAAHHSLSRQINNTLLHCAGSPQAVNSQCCCTRAVGTLCWCHPAPSADPAVVTRTSSEVILPQEVILLDATTAPERSSPSFPFLLSAPCIMYLFFHISLYLDCLSNEIYDLSCSHKIAMPAQGKEWPRTVGSRRVVLLFFFLILIKPQTKYRKLSSLFLQMLQV